MPLKLHLLCDVVCSYPLLPPTCDHQQCQPFAVFKNALCDSGHTDQHSLIDKNLFEIRLYLAKLVCSRSIWHHTLCSEKNTHSHFLSYLHELFVDLNKNCSEYT